MLIENNIYEGSTEHTDVWRAYLVMDQRKYARKAVKNSQFWKDSTSGVHTNTVEEIWNSVGVNSPMHRTK